MQERTKSMTLVKELAKIEDELKKKDQFKEKLSTYINSSTIKPIIKKSISNDIYINESILDTTINKTIEFHVTDSSQFSGLDSCEISIFEKEYSNHESYELCSIRLKPVENQLTKPTYDFEVIILHMDDQKLTYDDVYTYIKNAVGIEDESES